MKKIVLIIAICFLAFSPVLPQMVGQWLYVGDTEFSSLTTKPLSSSKSKFLATITASTFKNNILQISDDGGSTWYEVRKDLYYYSDSSAKPKPTSHKREYQAIERPSENLLLLLVTDNIPTEGNYWTPVLYRSSDKGQTWDTVNISPLKVKSYYQHSLAMFNENFGLSKIYIYDSLKDNDVSAFLKTTDGGRNWERILIPDSASMNILPSTGIQILDIDEFCNFTNSGIQYINLKTNVFRTIKTPSTNLHSITVTPGRKIFACGGISTGMGAQERSIIYKSDDFGVNWVNQIDSLYNPDCGLDYIDFYDDLNGIAVGGLSRILRTSDGGINWTLDPPPFPYYQVPFSYLNYFGKDQAIVLSRMNITKFSGKMVLLPPTLNSISYPDSVTNFTLNWNAVDGALSYHLQIAEYEMSDNPGYFGPDFEQRLRVDTVITGKDSINLKNVLTYSKQCYARIKSIGKDESSDWSHIWIFISPKDPSGKSLTAPTLVYPQFGAINLPVDITFLWSAVYGATDYTLYVSKKQIIDSTTIIVMNIKDTKCTVKDLLPNQLYFWWMSANSPDKISGVTGWRVFNTGSVSEVYNEPNQQEMSFMISPNPASDFINISVGARHALPNPEISIFNVFGEIVKNPTQTLPEGEGIRIDVSGLPSGVYFVRVGDKVRKFLKI